MIAIHHSLSLSLHPAYTQRREENITIISIRIITEESENMWVGVVLNTIFLSF